MFKNLFEEETHFLEGFSWRGGLSDGRPVHELEEKSTDGPQRKLAGYIYMSKGKWIAEVAETKTLPTENFMVIDYFEDEGEAKRAVENAFSRRL